MKGFMIYETPLWGDVDNVVYLQEVKDASYTLKQIGSDDITCYLEGIATKDPVTKATCNKDDAYDFEVGALIALMKKCGAKKSAEACCEAFPHETSGSIYRENKRYIKRIKELEEKVDNLYAYNKNLINEIDQKNHEIISLKAFKLTNESLKKDNESFRKTIAVKNRDIDHLFEENKELHKNIDELFGDNKYWKSEGARLSFKNHRLEEENDRLKNTRDFLINKNAELIEKNEKLKLDCGKLQHGYNDMIFCGGRQNGKQYTLLVDLFKKIPQNKVDEAYKEAYNTKLLVWQREFLKEALSIYKPPTKREQMWNDILACGDCEHSKYVEVKKKDLEMFAKECNEKKIFNVNGNELRPREYWFDDDSCIFQIFRKPAGFICANRVCFAYENAIIDYLPPMRWDLFEKGRKIVKVTPENIDEFIVKCTNKFGSIMKPVLKRYKDFTHIFVMISDYHYDNKPALHIMSPEDLVRNQHENPKKYNDKKIVDWEDVR